MRYPTRLTHTLLIGSLLWLVAFSLRTAPTAQAQTTPALTLATGLSVQPGAAVAVPMTFQSNGTSIGAISFALDFDQACLTYSNTTFALPAGFIGAATLDLADSDSELDVVVFSLPVIALPATLNPLLTLNFTALTGANCPAGTTTTIAFAADPIPSFGTTAGGSLSGTTTNGTVTIGSGASTATATNTPTNTPVVSTATATNTPTNTPVVSTATATNTPTNTPVVSTATATNTPTNTPVVSTATPTNTPTNTPVVSTATATNTPTNTPVVSTATATNTPTNTPVVSTATPTTTPVAAAAVVLSSAKNGTARGLNYRDEDIIQYNPASGQWTLVFDGSDVGLGDEDVDAFAFSQGVLLLSFDDDFKLAANYTVNNQTLKVEAADILAFVPTQLGQSTRGQFQLYLVGETVGLDSSGENIDVITFDELGNLLVSVTGGFKATDIKGDDEDLFVWNAATRTWSLYFDGSRVGLTQSGEDVRAAWADHSRRQLYLSTRDDYRVTGASGSEDDIFLCTYTTLGADTACTFTPFFDGKAFGFKEAIDGIFIGVVPLPVAATAAEAATDDTLVYPGDDADTPDELDGNETDDEEALDNHLFLPLVAR